MYEAYYGLAEKPFSLTPDTDFFYQSGTHREALNVLLVAIKSGDGFIKVTGEVGTGKTLLCRKLLDALNDNFNTVYIPNPYMNCNALLDAVIAEMGIADKLEKDNYLACINDYLIDSAKQSKTTVIILDEAQSLPEESLEAIRLLSNLETEKKKLVQIILFGQPELDHKLAQSSIRQLQQRIMHAYQLMPLDEEAIRAYLQHRVESAGYSGPELFDQSARRLLFKISHGVPRIINVLSNKAMMQSYASGEFYVSRKHIQTAARDGKVIPLKAGRQGLRAAMLAMFAVSIYLTSLYQ
ncbi:MAG: AAA family ATPase [Gammaproteobacteria bacterium]|nr:AAA family ATPase [Gammaproteobacteria bacterium]